MRASHDTRDETVAELRRGYLAGRLKTDTFASRVDQALQAESREQLRGLTVDIRAPAPGSPLTRLLTRLRTRRSGLLAAGDHLAAGRIVLGRSSGCHLVLADDSVSRRHAELVAFGGRWHVRDLGSTNGTWVNGRQVGDAEVRPGDVLHLGACELLL
jgi:FHA domain/Domain of unknown function (DUF1707)